MNQPTREQMIDAHQGSLEALEFIEMSDSEREERRNWLRREIRKLEREDRLEILAMMPAPTTPAQKL